MKLEELEVYQLAKDISKDAWKVYETLDWQTKKILGDQFICAIDSIGANIAEGFGRYHYLDKNKFNYNARGSLFESLHWVDTLAERGKMEAGARDSLKSKLERLAVRLNNYIMATKNQSKK